MPLISVIIPVYNAARYIESAIASVQQQTVRDIEIIAVDDGSKDTSKAILENISKSEPRLRLISRPNTGIVGALNDALAAASGEFIARMDADDLSLPQRFEKQLAALRNNSELVAVGSHVLFTDPENEPLKTFCPPEHHDEIFAQLLEGNGGALIHPAMMARRSAIEKIGRYRPETRNFLEDLDLYLRLAHVGKLANLPEVLLHYRQHPSSINRMPGPRAEIARLVLNPFRRAHGLSDFSPPQPISQKKSEHFRTWAAWAIEGKNHSIARKNAWRAVKCDPLELENWKFLRYAYSATANS